MMHPRLAPTVPLVLVVSLTLCLAIPLRAQNPAGMSIGRPVGMSAYGGRTYSISGRVLDDATNQPIERAQVTLRRFTGAPLQEAFVGMTGAFMFSGLGRGTYYVTASHADYEEKQETVRVAGAPVSGVRLFLRAKSRSGTPVLVDPIDVSEQLIPKKARKAYGKGVAEYRRHKWEAALAHFDQALKLHPKYASAWHAKGVIHLRQVKLEPARRCFQQAIEVNPNVAAPRVLLGGVYNALHRYLEAEEQLLKAVRLRPNSWLAHFELSRAYWQLRNLPKAEKAIIRAHELNSTIPQVHLMRCNVFLAREDYREAMAELDEFLKLVPEGPFADSVRRQRTQLRARLAGDEKP